MPRGLDHIVHTVRDLDAAGDFYARLGFQVSGRNKHPFGTHNRAVQLNGVYIEILTVAEPEKVVPHDGRAFSFSAYQQHYLERAQGLSMLMLNSSDAVQDARAYREAGIGDYAVLDFGRDGVRADGTPVKLAFSLAFASDPASPLAGFGACQHHYPENFWNAAAQRHDNGASDVAGAVMVATAPATHREFLGAYTGLSELHGSPNGVSARTEHGEIEIVEPALFADRYGNAPQVAGEGAGFAGLRIAVDDPLRVERLARRNGVACELRAGRLVVPPQAAFGATLVFEPPTMADHG